MISNEAREKLKKAGRKKWDQWDEISEIAGIRIRRQWKMPYEIYAKIIKNKDRMKNDTVLGWIRVAERYHEIDLMQKREALGQRGWYREIKEKKPLYVL